MYDLREIKNVDLRESECLKVDTTYKFVDDATQKQLIAKFISYYDDSDDAYLMAEFKKLALLSGEPEVATVYYLAKGTTNDFSRSCYVMDFIEGQTLKQFLSKRKSIIYEVLYDLTIQLVSGLEKAHNFEIFHSDLHDENIIIDQIGYLKLIDFLWWDYNLPKKTNQEKDLSDFKEHVRNFYSKCKISEKKRFKIILDRCESMQSFRGVKKELEMLNEVSFEMSLLNESSLQILSKLFELTTLNQLRMAIEINNHPILEELIPELTPKEEGYIEKIRSGTSQKFIDARILLIQKNMHQHVAPKLFELKQVDLIDWNVGIVNDGIPYAGPYVANVRIWFTSKFLKWKKLNELVDVLDVEKSDLESLLSI